MASVAIITARGGSKRIPRKNIKDFCGKPIIAYSIDAAKTSGIFDEVMVSTDDEEIAEIARKFGATVPFMRSTETADDYATTEEVLQEVLAEYEKRGQLFDMMCCLYPTAPFVTACCLRKAYTIFGKYHADELIPVVKFSYPPQRGFVIRNGILVYERPQFMQSRSQDLELLYHDAGQFYFYDTIAFLKSIREHYILRSIPMILKDSEVQDIDTIEDWNLAVSKYNMLHSRE